MLRLHMQGPVVCITTDCVQAAAGAGVTRGAERSVGWDLWRAQTSGVQGYAKLGQGRQVSQSTVANQQSGSETPRQVRVRPAAAGNCPSTAAKASRIKPLVVNILFQEAAALALALRALHAAALARRRAPLQAGSEQAELASWAGS